MVGGLRVNAWNVKHLRSGCQYGNSTIAYLINNLIVFICYFEEADQNVSDCCKDCNDADWCLHLT